MTRVNRHHNHTASKLARLRLARGFTQQQLAARAGISRATVSLIETGRIPLPRLRTALALADVLDCDVDALFGKER